MVTKTKMVNKSNLIQTEISPSFVYTTRKMWLIVVSLKGCVSVKVVELNWLGSATTGATLSTSPYSPQPSGLVSGSKRQTKLGRMCQTV